MTKDKCIRLIENIKGQSDDECWAPPNRIAIKNAKRFFNFLYDEFPEVYCFDIRPTDEREIQITAYFINSDEQIDFNLDSYGKISFFYYPLDGPSCNFHSDKLDLFFKNVVTCLFNWINKKNGTKTVSNNSC